MTHFPDSDLHGRLRSVGILPTQQRLAVAAVLLDRPRHMTADQVMRAAQEHFPRISRATVYAVLQLFVRHALLKELPVEGAATVYDSNLQPHHHLYDVESGIVTDLPDEALTVSGVSDALGGLQLAGVDVIVRVRRPRPAAN